MSDEERIILNLFGLLVNAVITMQCAIKSLPPLKTLEDFRDKLNHVLSNPLYSDQPQDPDAAILSYYEASLTGKIPGKRRKAKS